MTAVREALGADLRTVRVRRRRRDAVVLSVLALAVGCLGALALMFGARFTPPADVLDVLLGRPVPGASFAVGELRLPRTIGAILAGAAFGLGGTIFQTVLRNVLASPDVIGINSGASAAAIIALGVFGASGPVVAGSAIAGALLTAALVWFLAYQGGLSGIRFALVGIAVGAALQAIIGFVLTRSNVTQAQQAVVWMTGSLSRSLWDQLQPLAPVLAVLLLVALIAGRDLPVLRLGDDVAASLGVRVRRLKLVLILCAVVLVATATAVTGPIAFVAFLSGPIAMRITRHGQAVPAVAALIGAVIVLGADLIGQQLLSTAMPVGVVTGVLGAPYLLWLLMTGRTRA
ncbi:FecCD family ABC transporter permease [Rhizomonospora bruguierae]|uniref:FecCD family ABC transporter permease n=1 Tax=Rhizomonospora bruguierae TaxID=1581705 RepID=UPI0020BDF239|nr:iron chelate uptake ABC transporter family permease subunit [Micromonospora sp. NBRC 107566]